MSENNVWFITGAARGMGIDIAKAALEAGHWVVATARDAANVTAALGQHENLLAVSLDITDPAAAQAAADAAVERFGSIDVLVNNAGNFYAGYFEEISDKQFRAQMETNFFGPLNVTRAVLPVMRKQRRGHVITITSAAGIIGQEFCAAYAASKFALEGWMESLQYDVAALRHQHHHRRTRVLPHRTPRRRRLLDLAGTLHRGLRRAHHRRRSRPGSRMNGQQGGDPAKLGAALVTIAALDTRRCAAWPALTSLQESSRRPSCSSTRSNAHRELSSSMALETRIGNR